MDTFDVTMQARQAYEIRLRLAEFARNGPRIPSRLVVNAVVQQTVRRQIHPSAIRFVQIVVVNCENVAVFQIGESAIVAPEQSLRQPDI
ncbi:MAG TPA: hypothetical protein VGR55_00395 [Candidatus Acidoferrum sp.]|nr:hypothetical protein [Candidatus Acidoferrum sp.]